MKAIALISGGLDSTLAAKITQDLGIELVCLNTKTPFCLCDHHSASGCFHTAAQVAKNLGLELVSLNVTNEFLEIVKDPPHGYGSNMNPCIDCRILLFKKAKELMHKVGASFVITGEVVGQRPMSQKPHTLRLIEKEAGLEGLVLRPLSAKVMKDTIPEKEGWVARDKLLAINGRGRKEQFALAGKFGIKDYPCPAGGCLLTDPEFSKRLKELIKYAEFSLENILFLKVGRHFRISAKAKLIVGRNEEECKKLEVLAQPGDYLFFPLDDIAGATSLGRGSFDEDLIRLSAEITCRYCDLGSKTETQILYRRSGEAGNKPVTVSPAPESLLAELRI